VRQVTAWPSIFCATPADDERHCQQRPSDNTRDEQPAGYGERSRDDCHHGEHSKPANPRNGDCAHVDGQRLGSLRHTEVPKAGRFRPQDTPGRATAIDRDKRPVVTEGLMAIAVVRMGN
jgi:hypothetical protein